MFTVRKVKNNERTYMFARILCNVASHFTIRNKQFYSIATVLP